MKQHRANARRLLSFARVPYGHANPETDVAIIGAPLDDSLSLGGQRLGPFGIRLASGRIYDMGGHDPIWGFNVLRKINIVDVGDVEVMHHSTLASYERIEQKAQELFAGGKAVIAMGGTHGVSLPLLRAAARVHGPLSLIDFDSHTDTVDEVWETRYNHGTQFRRAAEEGLVVPERSIQIGIRGPNRPGFERAESERLGYEVLTSYEAITMTAEDVASRIRSRVAERKAYLSFDIDVIDPADAPGTGAPEVQGLSLGFLLTVLRGLDGLQILGFDVVEVSPLLEPGAKLGCPGVTTSAAANLIFVLLGLTAKRIRGPMNS